MPASMQSIVAPAPVETVASGGDPASYATVEASVNPSMDIVSGAIMAMEPEQVDRMERAAAQQAAVILQTLVQAQERDTESVEILGEEQESVIVQSEDVVRQSV